MENNSLREMLGKVAAAKNDEERQALLAELGIAAEEVKALSPDDLDGVAGGELSASVMNTLYYQIPLFKYQGRSKEYMNVDSFDEAYETLTAHGFKNFYGDNTVETKSFRSALMISPSGFAINLVQHIKDRE